MIVRTFLNYQRMYVYFRDGFQLQRYFSKCDESDKNPPYQNEDHSPDWLEAPKQVNQIPTHLPAEGNFWYDHASYDCSMQER